MKTYILLFDLGYHAEEAWESVSQADTLEQAIELEAKKQIKEDLYLNTKDVKYHGELGAAIFWVKESLSFWIEITPNSPTYRVNRFYDLEGKPENIAEDIILKPNPQNITWLKEQGFHLAVDSTNHYEHHKMPFDIIIGGSPEYGMEYQNPASNRGANIPITKEEILLLLKQ